jgi:uncharacterized protein
MFRHESQIPTYGFRPLSFSDNSAVHTVPLLLRRPALIGGIGAAQDLCLIDHDVTSASTARSARTASLRCAGARVSCKLCRFLRPTHMRPYSSLFRAAPTALLMLAFIEASVAGPLGGANAAYRRGDYATAARIFRSLAERGDPDAQHNLGAMYLRGQGVPQNFAKASKWFQKAADQGKTDSQFNLGLMYAQGQGVPQSYVNALAWLREAGDRGDAIAQSDLGLMYKNGQGTRQNYAEALKWYRLAANHNVAVAQFNLGSMYAEAQGTPLNYTEAVRWYRRAADQGLADAQTNLAYFYLIGLGVPRDYVQSYKWFNLATALSEESARKNTVGALDSVAAKMTPAQIAEAQKLVHAWKLQHPKTKE